AKYAPRNASRTTTIPLQIIFTITAIVLVAVTALALRHYWRVLWVGSLTVASVLIIHLLFDIFRDQFDAPGFWNWLRKLPQVILRKRTSLILIPAMLLGANVLAAPENTNCVGVILSISGQVQLLSNSLQKPRLLHPAKDKYAHLGPATQFRCRTNSSVT